MPLILVKKSLKRDANGMTAPVAATGLGLPVSLGATAEPGPAPRLCAKVLAIGCWGTPPRWE